MKMTLLLVACLLPAVAQPTKADRSKDEINCLRANIYFEARGESLKGKSAVAKVTLNRVLSKKYPNTVCKVVFQPVQFSWVKSEPFEKIQKVLKGDLKGLQSKDVRAYHQAEKIAQKALKTPKDALPEVGIPGNVLYYHADYVKPLWSTKMQRVKQIGKHIFYRSKE